MDFDQQYGHRNDVEGYGAALEQFDAWLPDFERALRPRRPGDFHRRPRLRPDRARHRSHPRVRAAAGLRTEVRRGVDLGLRASLSDIGQTVAENFGASIANGEAF